MTSCWFWSGSYFSNGYGQAWSRSLKRGTQAHRLVYEELIGSIPDGMQLDHLCRVRGCVNPTHLRVVTCRENIHADGSRCVAAANTAKAVCLRGHLLSGENLYIAKVDGRRHCRECRRDWKRAIRAARHEVKVSAG